MRTDYNLLSTNEKAAMLWNNAEFIEGIELNDYDVSLYSLDDELIEIYFSVENNRVEKVGVLNDPERLKLYTINPKNRKKI